MTTLPEWIYFNGSTYYFNEWEAQDERLKGWWLCGYWPEGDPSNMPPEVFDGNRWYCLVSSDPHSKEKAESDLLEKINNMKPWLMIKN